jgi:hypothetical protein
VNKGISPAFLTDAELERRLDAGARTSFQRRIDAYQARAGINTDQHPTEVMAALSYQISVTDPRAAGWFSAGNRFGRWLTLLPLLLLFAAPAFWRRRQRFALGFAAYSTGLSGMTASLFLLLAYQAAAGTVYGNIVLFTTALMLGSAAGGAYRQPVARRWRLVLLDAGNGAIVLLPLLLLSVSERLPTHPSQLNAGFLAVAITVGLLIGAEFIAVNRAYAGAGSEVIHTAGSLYAVDLIGGFTAAVLSSVFLVPALGMTATAIAVLSVKALSVIMLATSRNDPRPAP